MFQPWIGSKYGKTRLLILGESAYSWFEDNEWQHPPLDHAIGSVGWAINNFPASGRFFAMVSRALANEESPTKDRLEAVWARVAFTNYISMTVGCGPRVRPTTEMWEEAKDSFLSDLTDQKKFPEYPRRVVVLGKTMWGKMPESHIYITDEVQGYRLAGDVVMCQAMDHPAGGLSWRKLASVLYFTYEQELKG